jgi:hypothetical protein
LKRLLLTLALLLAQPDASLAQQESSAVRMASPSSRRINFVSRRGRFRTPTPSGWEEYDGAPYSRKRGYGWLADLSHSGWDDGEIGAMILPDGSQASPRELGRPELANWQGTHQENLSRVFRIDLPDGWYRVTCSSVHANNAPLPLVDQRSIKFRAHNAVFAGPRHGAPLRVQGNRLVEGSAIVEVTDRQLRIVVGDPAYAGWTWSHPGPWYRGWWSWVGMRGKQRYATTWYEKLTRVVDPGFHSLRLNALQLEPAAAPGTRPSWIFRDYLARDNNTDVNRGLAPEQRWIRVALQPGAPARSREELYQTSIRVSAPAPGASLVGLLQQQPSPADGVVHYSTSVSLFMGAGSRRGSGLHEAGVLLLAEPSGPTDFNSTFVGVAFDGRRSESRGLVRYRVGDGKDGYRTDLEIAASSLPFPIAEGEFEIAIEHDVEHNVLRSIRVNGVDVASRWSPHDRSQRISRGLFGIRSAMESTDPQVQLGHFYWYYQVERW